MVFSFKIHALKLLYNMGSKAVNQIHWKIYRSIQLVRIIQGMIMTHSVLFVCVKDESSKCTGFVPVYHNIKSNVNLLSSFYGTQHMPCGGIAFIQTKHPVAPWVHTQREPESKIPLPLSVVTDCDIEGGQFNQEWDTLPQRLLDISLPYLTSSLQQSPSKKSQQPVIFDIHD